jgi:hypothetical protein
MNPKYNIGCLATRTLRGNVTAFIPVEAAEKVANVPGICW